MIDREDLHKIILLEGYTQEQADAYCEWYFGPYGWKWSIDQMAAAFEAIKQAIGPTVAAIEEMLAEIKEQEYFYEKEELPRPPKCAGPQNKGRTWSNQPPRLARSHCRKYRR